MINSESGLNDLDHEPKPRFIVTAQRDPQHSILEAQPELDWANRKVYNPSNIKIGEVNHMIFRAVGTKDNVSRLGHGVSLDGINFSIDKQPFLEPEGSLEALGVEDPRFTVMDEPVELDGEQYDIIGSYTGVKPWTAQIKLMAMSSDLQRFSARYPMLPDWDMDKPEEERDLWNTPHGRPIIFPGFNPDQWDQESHGNWTKAAGIFPRKINGQYWALWGEYKIRAATSKDLKHWDVIETPILEQRPGKHDSAYLEMGPAPIETSFGWLVFYNMINSLEQEGRVYGIGWAMLDANDPSKIIDRCDKPILIPETEDETTGEIDIALINGKTVRELTQEEFAQHKDQIPMAVFCNSAIKVDEDTFALCYGAGDKRIKRAIVKIKKAT